MADRCLGKQRPREDARTLRLASYLRLPKPPAGFGVVPSSSVVWKVLANDRLGDCTIAAAAHADMAWRKASGRPDRKTITTGRVISDYSAITGYDPADPSTDQGAVELDVLKAWRARGICGHKIAAFAAATVDDHAEVRAACWLLGGLYIGVALPLTAQDQRVWDVVDDAGSEGEPWSWGGHAVNVIGYDARGLTFVSWGKAMRMTWGFWSTYVDEAWGVVSGDYLRASTHRTPAGFNRDQLLADVAAL